MSRASAIAVSAARDITRWPMPLSPSTSAVAGALLRHGDVRVRIEAAGLQPPHILRQAEHTMRVGAGEVRLAHHSGAYRRILARQAGGASASVISARIAATGTLDCSLSAPRSRVRLAHRSARAIEFDDIGIFCSPRRRGRMRAKQSASHIDCRTQWGADDDQSPASSSSEPASAGSPPPRRWPAAPFDVTVIDRHNYHLFQPLLYQVATAGLSPGRHRLADPQHPARASRTSTSCSARSPGIDIAAARGDRRGPPHSLRHSDRRDRRAARLFRPRRLGGSAPGLKTIDDATYIRRRILLAFEKAETEADRSRARAAAELRRRRRRADRRRDGRRHRRAAPTARWRRISARSIRARRASSWSRRRRACSRRSIRPCRRRRGQSLEQLGVEVRLGAAVTAFDADGVVDRRRAHRGAHHHLGAPA